MAVGVLKNTNGLSQFWRPEVPKPRYPQDCFLLKLQERICLLSFFSFYWTPASLARGLPPHPVALTSASMVTAPLTLTLPPPLIRMISPPGIQNNLPISRSLTQSHLQRPFCLVNPHIHRSGPQGVGIFGGPLSCLPQEIKSGLHPCALPPREVTILSLYTQ